MALASLLQNAATCTVAAIGGPGETEAAAVVAEEPGVQVVNAAGCLSVAETAAAIASLDLLIAGDSGAAHMAYALGIPSITLLGATDVSIWGPPDDPRHSVIAGRHRSVANITPLEVFTAAHRWLTSSGVIPPPATVHPPSVAAEASKAR
jgi:ADP-heptose:LPS heptosyltransferase